MHVLMILDYFVVLIFFILFSYPLISCEDYPVYCYVLDFIEILLLAFTQSFLVHVIDL